MSLCLLSVNSDRVFRLRRAFLCDFLTPFVGPGLPTSSGQVGPAQVSAPGQEMLKITGITGSRPHRRRHGKNSISDSIDFSCGLTLILLTITKAPISAHAVSH
jgi:hypothetical protein